MYGGDGETRTLTPRGAGTVNPVRLPISPRPQHRVPTELLDFNLAEDQGFEPFASSVLLRYETNIRRNQMAYAIPFLYCLIRI